MKFLIQRASDYAAKNAPVVNAECIALKRTSKHDVYENAWMIEIQSLEDLLAFVADQGEVIVSGSGLYKETVGQRMPVAEASEQQPLLDLPGILIYDNYIE